MGADKLSKPMRVRQLIASRGYGFDEETGRLSGVSCNLCLSGPLELSEEGDRLTCAGCGERISEPLEYLLSQPVRRGGPAQRTAESLDGGIDPNARLGPEAPVAHAATLEEGQHISGPPNLPGGAALGASAHPARAPGRPWGEWIIISGLAAAFLVAGLLAAAMSGYANYLAFGAMVEDPFQARVWSLTGLIACVCSFGGFTFAYWHAANRRRWEAARALFIAFAGAATSLVGSQLYMQGEAESRAASVEAGAARVAVLDAQIADWRTQLGGIDPGVRSIEGLEAYLAEVERVGRTNERPYRAALDELGQARRRADLEAQIAAARTDVSALAETLATPVPAGTAQARSWFFAAMLEVFSSQGTSIGCVALMLLMRRREPVPVAH
ncbi:MAG: hypothetical protein AAGH87_06765 [Pseudomonadota bacterium]